MNLSKRISATDLMDVSLNKLKADGPFADEHSTMFKDIEIDPTLVVRAWEQLITDGYVYSKTQEVSKNETSIRFYITLEGVIAIESCPFFLKGRPYKWKVVQSYISIAWKVTTVVAVLANALIVLIFTYLTYIKP